MNMSAAAMDSDSCSACSRPSSPEPPAGGAVAGFLSEQLLETLCRDRGSAGAPGGHAQPSKEELRDLRLRVNRRERKRMHDLNRAMDGLREVMPYAQGPSVRKLSKICTLLLARSYILMLSSSLEEMRKLLGEVYAAPAGPPRVPVRPRSPPPAGFLGFGPAAHPGASYARYRGAACPCPLCRPGAAGQTLRATWAEPKDRALHRLLS